MELAGVNESDFDVSPQALCPTRRHRTHRPPQSEEGEGADKGV